MVHLALLITSVLAVECLVYFDLKAKFNSMWQVCQKVRWVLPSKKISDHWKEITIAYYSRLLMGYSLQILAVLLLVLGCFLLAELLQEGLINYTTSAAGIVESLLFILVYSRLRKVLK